ncbi:CYTH domain-containing protein [Aureimonas sp. AU22]|jgi:adenylate cyclase|uniref:CYTH domain-containing protein n=1 Tax=Aureimonas sp. AU22 TaxID=1638162 RepID=UPI000783FB64|nr:CYTH domain-containing protein [Aureimonas sp. AU22]
MHIEIERKFLVVGNAWRAGTVDVRTFRDGLVSQGANGKVRVRIDGQKAWLTVKGARSGISRAEFEYEIPLDDAERLLADICGPIIEKDRHIVPHEGRTWEIDVFKGPLAGLVWAEVELDHPDQVFAIPEWVGREVTGNPRFRHANLLNACAANDGTSELRGLMAER